jgi:hypothetical protein
MAQRPVDHPEKLTLEWLMEGCLSGHQEKEKENTEIYFGLKSAPNLGCPGNEAYKNAMVDRLDTKDPK